MGKFYIVVEIFALNKNVWIIFNLVGKKGDESSGKEESMRHKMMWNVLGTVSSSVGQADRNEVTAGSVSGAALCTGNIQWATFVVLDFLVATLRK